MEQQEQQQQAQEQAQVSPEQEQQEEQVQAQIKENYVPDDSEKHLYHVQLEKPLFSPKTAKRLSVPYVQKFSEAEYKALVDKKSEKDKSNAEMLGLTVVVLWDPKKNNI